MVGLCDDAHGTTTEVHNYLLFRENPIPEFQPQLPISAEVGNSYSIVLGCATEWSCVVFA
jgi:hypothetical protein